MKYWVLMFCLCAAAILVITLVVRQLSDMRRDALKEISQSTQDKGCTVATVSHDEHLFVIGRFVSGTAMLHHPGCPCQK